MIVPILGLGAVAVFTGDGALFVRGAGVPADPFGTADSVGVLVTHRLFEAGFVVATPDPATRAALVLVVPVTGAAGTPTADVDTGPEVCLLPFGRDDGVVE